MKAVTATRVRVLRAAEDVFAEKGFHLAAVDEVAARAGVAKGTIFYNFGSKAALFEEVIANGMELVAGAIRREADSSRPPAEQIAAIIDLHVQTLLSSPGLIAIFSRELSAGLDDHVRQTIRRTRDRYVAFVAGLLDEALRVGIIRNLDTSMLASTLFDLALSACAYAAEHHGAGAPDAAPVSSFLSTFVLEGIAVR
jgi:AcrR family transcriptional regulator